MDTRRKVKTERLDRHHHWNAEGRVLTTNGYVMVRARDHFHVDGKGWAHEHVMLAEKALGKQLPRGAQVHHVDGNKQNNAPNNLVVCEDASYHRLLHQR